MSRYYRGRYRSDAWFVDGGANDEGYHYRYCHSCNKETEHGVCEGCITCLDRNMRSKHRPSKAAKPDTGGV